MAKISTTANKIARGPKKRTSIGCSNKTRPKNKNTRRMTKPYRGQGR